ncbi:MAG: type II secretion system protein [Candidatus Dojkabacteria bacterium]|nr:MAG: type II secretion system protein [Candidatus Dojkabacteria bacterium]
MKPKAFTLVELLVVMAIISFLSVGAFAGLSFGLRQARDTQRKKAVELVQIALQAYYSDYASYPKCVSQGTKIGNDWEFCSGAFPIMGTSGTITEGFLIDGEGRVGIKDYLEGEWPRGNSNVNPGENERYMKYYVNESGNTKLRYAVCVTLENTTAASNLVRKGDGNERDCYCVGTNYEEVACAQLEGRRNN